MVAHSLRRRKVPGSNPTVGKNFTFCNSRPTRDPHSSSKPMKKIYVIKSERLTEWQWTGKYWLLCYYCEEKWWNCGRRWKMFKYSWIKFVKGNLHVWCLFIKHICSKKNYQVRETPWSTLDYQTIVVSGICYVTCVAIPLIIGYITIMSDFQINQCYMVFSNTSSSRSTMRLILTDKVVNANVSFQIWSL